MLADTGTHGGVARVVNALMTAKEFSKAETTLEIMSDGAGTQWVCVLTDLEPGAIATFHWSTTSSPVRARYVSRAF